MMGPRSQISRERLSQLRDLAELAPLGCFVEVGVYRGGSAWHLAEVARRHGVALHLFDTFTGMPERGPRDIFAVGEFGDASLEDVKRAIPDAVFHIGMFPDTLPDDLAGIALAHIDCDQEKTARACIASLYPRLVPDGIMAFDDFGTIPGFTDAVKTAFPTQVRYHGTFAYVRAGHQLPGGYR